MSRTTVFEADEITVWYYPEKKIIHHQMHKYCHGRIFRDALMAGLETLKKHQAQKWLSDDRKNPVLDTEDTQQNMAIWLPQVIEAGWKYWAIVQPEAFVAKATLDTLAKDLAERGITVRLFSTPEKALQWLDSR